MSLAAPELSMCGLGARKGLGDGLPVANWAAFALHLSAYQLNDNTIGLFRRLPGGLGGPRPPPREPRH